MSFYELYFKPPQSALSLCSFLKSVIKLAAVAVPQPICNPVKLIPVNIAINARLIKQRLSIRIQAQKRNSSALAGVRPSIFALWHIYCWLPRNNTND